MTICDVLSLHCIFLIDILIPSFLFSHVCSCFIENNENTINECNYEIFSYLCVIYSQGTDALRFYLASHPKMLDSIQNEVHFFDKKCEEELDKLCDRAVIEKKKLLEDESSEVATEVIQQVRDEYASNWHFWKLNKNHHHRNNHDNDNDEDEGDNKLIPSISMQSKYTFEKTPRYLFHPFVPSRIKAVVPWTKIIILLRDPLERAYSQFKMDYERKILQTNKRRKKDVSSYGEVTFETCVDIDIQKLIEVGILGDDEKVLDADDDDENERRWLKYWDIWDEDYLTKEKVCDGEIARGLYYFQLQRWFKEYSTAEDRDKIFITKSESLLPDKKTKVIDMKAMTDFIGIDEMEVVAEEKIHATSSEFGPMQDETKQRLQAIYDPFNKKLGDILGEGWDDPWPYGQ